MTIKFEKKPTYTFNGQSFDTLEAAQIAAIGALHSAFAPSNDDSGKPIPDEVCNIILENADALTAIFKQTPRVRSSPKPRKSRKSTPAPAAA